MKLLFKLLFSLLFLSLLFNHIYGFQLKYFKYASVYFINTYHLNNFYFYMMFVEFVSIFIVFLKLPKWVVYIYDVLLSIYCIALIAALYTMYELTNGCIGCHYIASAFYDNNYFTLGIVVFLGLMYLFYLRDKIGITPREHL
jgi:hypothetical protein